MQLQRWGKAVAVSRWGRVRVFFKKDSNQDCSFFQDTPFFNSIREISVCGTHLCHYFGMCTFRSAVLYCVLSDANVQSIDLRWGASPRF